MCKWNKYGDTRIDPCMRYLIRFLKNKDVPTFACCCGHNKYPMSIILKNVNGEFYEVFTGKIIPRKRRFYKRDKQKYYYISEVVKK